MVQIVAQMEGMDHLTRASRCGDLAAVRRILLSAGADIYGAVPHFGTPLRIVCQTPSPPLKLLVRRFLAHRMRATARHWWLPWPLACRVAGFLV